MSIPEVWVDLDPNLNIDSRGGIKRAVNVDAVKSSINNILRTNPGERVFRPTFGAGIGLLIGEPTRRDSLNEISNIIYKQISIWDNRIINPKCDFIIRPDDNVLELHFSFQIRGYEEVFQFSLPLE